MMLRRIVRNSDEYETYPWVYDEVASVVEGLMRKYRREVDWEEYGTERSVDKYLHELSSLAYGDEGEVDIRDMEELVDSIFDELFAAIPSSYDSRGRAVFDDDIVEDFHSNLEYLSRYMQN